MSPQAKISVSASGSPRQKFCPNQQAMTTPARRKRAFLFSVNVNNARINQAGRSGCADLARFFYVLDDRKVSTGSADGAVGNRTGRKPLGQIEQRAKPAAPKVFVAKWHSPLRRRRRRPRRGDLRAVYRRGAWRWRSAVPPRFADRGRPGPGLRGSIYPR